MRSPRAASARRTTGTPEPDTAMPTLRDDTFRAIADLMHRSVGLSFGEHKKPLVASRLAPRLARLGLDDYRDYLSLISGQDDQGEFQVAVDLLTTNETYFFRESSHYALMEQELSRERPRTVRVWSAASSFGDEAYSAAMVLADLQQQGRIGEDWSVLGTDISDRVLRSAQQAIFPNERLREVSAERLKRYFWRGEGEAEGLSRCSRASANACASASSTCACRSPTSAPSTSSSCATC
ncbi:hypothetical protein FSC37_00290 [Piscinibacter aquaticus]|uniref:protein-glutamate O-methyltransferase n=1 Tax=Piscinibacter aquaticus TaxID=392597 RepID=A0A5C6U050_9BURK|nr:hypothetical protein FSC37_00290 [Piscinibacter aquaticus]